MDVKKLVERRDKLRGFVAQCQAQLNAAQGALMECEFLLGQEMEVLEPKSGPDTPPPAQPEGDQDGQDRP